MQFQLQYYQFYPLPTNTTNDKDLSENYNHRKLTQVQSHITHAYIANIPKTMIMITEHVPLENHTHTHTKPSNTCPDKDFITQNIVLNKIVQQTKINFIRKFKFVHST